MLGSQHLRTSLLAAASVDIITWYLPQPAQESVKEIGLSILYLTFFNLHVEFDGSCDIRKTPCSISSK